MLTAFSAFGASPIEDKSQSNVITLTQENSVFLKDVVQDVSMTKLMSELSKRENNSEPVLYLILDTPGGSVFSGLNLIHFLKGFKKLVKTITIFSASMGFQIVEGNPGERLILDTGTLMSHPMSGGEYGEIGDGLSMDKRINFIKEIVKTMDEQVVARTNGKQTLESYRKQYDNELYSTGSNAVELGYADRVAQVSCSSELLAENEIIDDREYIGNGFALDVKFEYSKCPLMLSILKYRVTIVDVIRNKKFIIMNSGYELPVEEKKKEPSLFDLFGESVSPQKEVDRITGLSKKYKTFMLFLDRSSLKTKRVDWL
jgi:ATP-dependent protease ClpP protease subunit